MTGHARVYHMNGKRKWMVLTLWFLFICFSGCNEQVSTVKDPTAELKEGRLTYSISGEGTTSAWELEILFNPGHAVINEKFARGAARKYIYDKKANEILGLIDDAAALGISQDNYFIYYTQEDLVNNALSSNYGDTAIEVTQDFKDILGFRCQKYNIRHGVQVTVEIWLADKIRPGILYPWTPLTFENAALEYEIKILGKTDRCYKIKSISDEKIPPREFEHVVPDPYYLVVPASVFSIDSLWASEFEENKFRSFSYPYFGDGREATVQYIKRGFSEIGLQAADEPVSFSFFVNKDGTLSEVEMRMGDSDSRQAELIKKLFSSMKPWTPAKVRGVAVRSKVLVFG